MERACRQARLFFAPLWSAAARRRFAFQAALVAAIV
jgi:hypothetical protein